NLNAMLARLEEAFLRRKRFLADAAHELRTPVAAMTVTLEVALRKPRDAESYRETVETCLADARVLRGLVESLLVQARSELPVLDESEQVIDLTEMIGQCTSILYALAQERHVRVLFN